MLSYFPKESAILKACDMPFLCVCGFICNVRAVLICSSFLCVCVLHGGLCFLTVAFYRYLLFIFVMSMLLASPI